MTKYGSSTTSQHSFSTVPSAEIQRSSFDRSSGVKTTFDCGDLVPIFVDEALPGDTMNLNMTTFARFATPIVPILDNMRLHSYWFAVPLRLLWINFRRFMGQQDDPGDSVDFNIPTVPSGTGFVAGSMFDYFGLPTNVPGLDVSALYARSYNLIWNEWFRDQNLQDSALHAPFDGPDLVSSFPMRKVAKLHDYFSSCLPWPQKGDSIELPLGTSAPVIADSRGYPQFDINETGNIRQLFGNNSTAAAAWSADPVTTGIAHWDPAADGPGLVADLTSATAATINQLRQAFQLQKLAERDARGGTRYTEIVRAHFNVTSPDARQSRPEFLGGGTQQITMTPVTQQSESGTTPQGNLAAYGVTSGGGHGFVHSFTEHCIVMGFVAVKADLNYQQGLHKQFTRTDKHDFYWPALAHLGEQAVLNKEIYAVGTGGSQTDEGVFGYQARWDEYRYKPGMITGKMRSNASGSLDLWHLAQDFDSLPVLGSAFIEEDPPIERIVATPTEPDLLFDGYIKLTHARPMPTNSVPGNIDRF